MFSSVDLLSTFFSCIFILSLGALVYWYNRKSATNLVFLLFSISVASWSIVNYLAFHVSTEWMSFFTRLTLCLATPHTVLYYFFVKTFPEEKIQVPRTRLLLIVLVTLLAMSFTMTSLVFPHVKIISGRPVPDVGPGMALVMTVIVGSSLAGVYTFFRRYKEFKRKGGINAWRLMGFGFFLMFAFLITVNLFGTVLFGDTTIIPFSSFSVMPFVVLSAYAIFRHDALGVKVITTEFFVLFLVDIFLVDALSETQVILLILKLVVALAIMILGVLLIRSVEREVKQRLRMTELAGSLEQTNLKLQELDKQKTDFLSIAAHQLRTPLSVINGYLELVRDGAYGKVTQGTKDILKNMDENNGHLIKLVDEFLDITRIEQGRTKFDFKPANVCKIIDSVVQELAERGAQKGLKLTWDANECSIEEAMLDDEKVRHVIFNFVDNAIKYTDKGTVSVSAMNEDDGISVRIVDTGFGFNKVDEANFFQKFYRGENVKGTNVNGTGLGLYVCKKFIDGHQGKIWAHSPGLGKGSEFGFWVPIMQQHPSAPFTTQSSIVPNLPIS